MNIDQLGEAILEKTDQRLVSAKDWQRPHVIGQRIQELNGMLELAQLRGEPELEREIQGHLDDLHDQLECEYRGMSVLTIALPPEMIRLCKGDGVEPQVVLCGFIADLCGIMNWANNPRADGYSSNGSDERRMAEEYYERVGYPFIHHDP
jgi:hypothetical protein